MNLSQLEAHLNQYPQSPLFANLAMEYLAEGRSADAIILCRGGIFRYPAYATAHLVLAKCYAHEGSYALALSSLSEAKKHVSHFPLYDTLYNEWSRLLIAGPNPAPVETAPTVESSTTTTETSPTNPGISPEELAQIGRPQNDGTDEWRIVSRTLAEIFATQGEYDEAIVTYRLLLQERPESGAEYQTRIEELIKLREAKMMEQQASEQKSPG